jgi:hypothetical protein
MRTPATHLSAHRAFFMESLRDGGVNIPKLESSRGGQGSGHSEELTGEDAHPTLPMAEGS